MSRKQRMKLALDAIERRARELGYTGVCGVLIANLANIVSGTEDISPSYRIVERMYRHPEPETRGADDLGTNYFAMVSNKLAEALRKLRDSGDTEIALLKGELGAKGAVIAIVDQMVYIAAFSGAPQGEVDYLIALPALPVLQS